MDTHTQDKETSNVIMDIEKRAQQFAIDLDVLMKQKKSVLLSTVKYDDDAIASILSLYIVLTQQYPHLKVNMAIPRQPNYRWRTLKHFEQIEFVNSIAKYASQFDALILVDTHEYRRIGINLLELKAKNITTICIDHHHRKELVESTPFDLEFIEPDASSSAELIYYAFCAKDKIIHAHLAELIIIGIAGDTGSLRHVNSSNAHVLSIVRRLVQEQRISLSNFILSFKKLSERQFFVIQELIKQARIIRPREWPPYLFSYLDREFVKKHNLTNLETDEAAGFFISAFSGAIEHAEWSLVLFPYTHAAYRAKLRSLSNKINVRLIAEGLGIGSGHDYSSGGVFHPFGNNETIEISECMNQLNTFLSEYRYDRVLERIQSIDE